MGVLTEVELNTAKALLEALLSSEIKTGSDLLIQLEGFLAQHESLRVLIRAGLRLVRWAFWLRHRLHFYEATLTQRQAFFHHLPVPANGLLQWISMPLRLLYLQDDQVATRYGKRIRSVPERLPKERWHQQIMSVDQLEKQQSWDVDVVIVGSGAGGSAAAYELARQGLAVLVLEEGEWLDRPDFNGDLPRLIPKLFRASGLTMALGSTLIPIPVGRCMGGTTTVNSGTAMPTPPEVLKRWRDAGLSVYTDEMMQEYLQEVLQVLKVQQADMQYVGEIGKIMSEGAKALGYSRYHPLMRNAEGCDGQALCQFGCPTGAKQSANVRYMPLALQSNALLVTGIKAEQLLQQGNQIIGILAQGKGQDGSTKTLTIKARSVILAMGTLFSPLFLQKNAIHAPQLGQQLSIHPAGVVLGYFPDRQLNHEYSIPQGFGVSDLSAEGLVFEGGTLPLLGHSMLTKEWGEELNEHLYQYPHTAYFGFMIRDSSRGSVIAGPHPDWPFIFYSMNDTDMQLFKKGILELARMYWAAGAQKIGIPSLKGLQIFHREADLTAWLPKRSPRDFLISAYHPLGTCRMAVDSENGVVDASLKVMGKEGLYVMDGSVVPGSLGVNPQVTIMALATRAARALGQQLV